MAAEGIRMGGDEIRRPPRWADALLRTCLNAEEAETESGDLLEAYRDSIYPERGRWQADLWHVRQVAGYLLRARGVERRNCILAGLVLCVLTIVITVLMYPGVRPRLRPRTTRRRDSQESRLHGRGVSTPQCQRHSRRWTSSLVSVWRHPQRDGWNGWQSRRNFAGAHGPRFR
jgi:hypothetical protein